MSDTKLQEYIAEQLAAGRDPDAIFELLVKSGWHPIDIRTAMSQSKKESQVPSRTRKRTRQRPASALSSAVQNASLGLIKTPRQADVAIAVFSLLLVALAIVSYQRSLPSKFEPREQVRFDYMEHVTLTKNGLPPFEKK